jgi:hypothetical protein
VLGHLLAEMFEHFLAVLGLFEEREPPREPVVELDRFAEDREIDPLDEQDHGDEDQDIDERRGRDHGGPQTMGS